MGHFSNGTQGMYYQAEYCDRCAHDTNQDCPIWLAHILFNDSQEKHPEIEYVLNLLIPTDEESGDNGKCTMFIPRAELTEDQRPPVDAGLTAEQVREWWINPAVRKQR